MNRHKFLSRGRTVKYKGSIRQPKTEAERNEMENTEHRVLNIEAKRHAAKAKKEAK